MKIEVFIADAQTDTDAIRTVKNKYNDWLAENDVEIKFLDTAVSEIIFPETENRYFTYVLTIGYVEKEMVDA